VAVRQTTTANAPATVPSATDTARSAGLQKWGELPAWRMAGKARVATEGAATMFAHSLEAAAEYVAKAAGEAQQWTPEGRARVLAALDSASRTIAAAKAPLLVAEEASGSWRAPGVRNYQDARARDTRSGRGAARNEVEDAHTIAALDGGADALASGQITEPHVRQLRSAIKKLPEPQRAELLAGDGAAEVLQLARTHDAPTFGRKVEEIIAAKSARQAEKAFQDVRATRHLTLRESPEGTHVNGLLDPVAGHTLRIALEAATPVPALDDTRTREQRNADAIATIARHALDDGAFKPGAPVRPHLTLTMDPETFARAREHQRAGSHTPDRDALGHAALGHAVLGREALGHAELGREAPAADAEPTLAPPVVRLEDGPVLPPSELGRILCSTDITRMVIDAESQVLDVGRTQRLYTGHLRRAVIARDKHCAWEGCTMPARFGEIHHMDWWDQDHGHTSVDRGVLVCEFHHHELHAHDLDIVRVPPSACGSTETGHDPTSGAAPPSRAESTSGGGATGRSGPTGKNGPARERPRYVTVPRSRTRTERAEAMRQRLRQEIYEKRAASRR